MTKSLPSKHRTATDSSSCWFFGVCIELQPVKAIWRMVFLERKSSRKWVQDKPVNCPSKRIDQNHLLFQCKSSPVFGGYTSQSRKKTELLFCILQPLHSIWGSKSFQSNLASWRSTAVASQAFCQGFMPRPKTLIIDKFHLYTLKRKPGATVGKEAKTGNWNDLLHHGGPVWQKRLSRKREAWKAWLWNRRTSQVLLLKPRNVLSNL